MKPLKTPLFSKVRNAFALAILIALLCTACAAPAATTSPEPTPTASTPSSPTPASDDSDDGAVKVDYATDKLLRKYDSVERFTDTRMDSSSVIFMADTAVKDFKFIELGFEEDGPQLKFHETAVLYALDELSPSKPLVVETLLPETIPTRGISYVDASNQTRYFAIALSGQDGSVFIFEF